MEIRNSIESVSNFQPVKFWTETPPDLPQIPGLPEPGDGVGEGGFGGSGAVTERRFGLGAGEEHPLFGQAKAVDGDEGLRATICYRERSLVI